MKQFLLRTIVLIAFFSGLPNSTVNAQDQMMPNFTVAPGTHITNTNGQWVTINATQPNNIDLVETRIFNMPPANSGIVGVEFKLIGGDGGTAHFHWGLNDKFANGGRGGELTFKLPLLNTGNYSRPFFVTLGKKGESTSVTNGIYTGAGGGGSTGMAWLVPNIPRVDFGSMTSQGYFIAAAGGGSGGYTTSMFTLDGNSATQDLSNYLDLDTDAVYEHLNVSSNGTPVLKLVSGGSALPIGLFIQYQPGCCSEHEKFKASSSNVYNVFDYQNGAVFGSTGTSLLDFRHGQKGGKAVTPYVAAEGTGNTTGLGLSAVYEMKHLGGMGGSGFGGGGSGVSTTTYYPFFGHEMPTGGAGGTSSLYKSSKAHLYPQQGDAGGNNYRSYLQNVVITPRSSTNSPQSGRMMYRAIMDGEPPVIDQGSTPITLNIGNGKPFPLHTTDAPLTMEMLAPYIGPGKAISDNDGIKSIQFQQPTQLSCSDVGQTIMVFIKATDFAGNTTSAPIVVTVTDNFVPVVVLMEHSSNISDPGLPWRIDVSNGAVDLTAANFPKSYDSCSGNNVTVHFPPTTFNCSHVGIPQTITFYVTDSDGNQSPEYTKTFNVVSSEITKLYVDAAATGTNDGSSWTNAFTSLQDALQYGCLNSGSQRDIYVAKGTYRPDKRNGVISNDRNATFSIPGNYKVYGGFPSGGTELSNRNPEINPTILSGEIGNNLLSDNSFHVVTIAGKNTLIDGFTIRDGFAYNNVGGGLIIQQTETSLTSDHTTTITNCKFLGNFAPQGIGGALYADYNNTNAASQVNLYVKNCLFDGNIADAGGAVYFDSYATAANINQQFVNNVFINNSATVYAGALFALTGNKINVVNNTFSNNNAGTNGGAIVNMGTIKLHNSILFFNKAAGVPNEIQNFGTFQVSHNNIQGSGGSGNWNLSNITDLGNNIDADPLFHTSPSWSILPQSPCLNVGSNSYNTELYDIQGNTRVTQVAIDMGAFEANPIVYVAADASSGGDGNSWATAFKSLNEGITVASASAIPKDIWIKEGTYRPERVPGSNTVTPNNRDNTFYLDKALKLFGGFSGTETNVQQRNIGQHPTILSGDIGLSGNSTDNTYHVITLQAGNIRLDGLIVESGFANHMSDIEKLRGAGVYEYADNASAENMVMNCVFRNNFALENGGAWYVKANQNATTRFIQSVFYYNIASRGAASFIQMDNATTAYTQNYYNITAVYNTASAGGVTGAFEAFETAANRPAGINFYNSLLAENAPKNHSDITNPGHILLSNTYTAATTAGIFVNASAPTGADGKIMTNDDGLQLLSSSPAIDFGNSASAFNGINKDITGNLRIRGNIDAGAYESLYDKPLISNANGIIYVKQNASGNGTSWDNATSDLHNAIHATGVQKVYVAVGTYKVGDHSFIMKNNVEIYGGFDPDNGITDISHNRIMPGTSVTKGSVLDGENTRPVIWNVFTASTVLNNTAVLDGFCITKGSFSNGAGMRNIYASPTLRNLSVWNNKATNSGAGIYNSASNPFITNTLIGANSVMNGTLGGIALGAGVMNTDSSAPVFTNVTLTGNMLFSPIGVMKGAGIYSFNSSPKIYNSIIWNNSKMGNMMVFGADIENEGTVSLTLKNSMTQLYATGNPADKNKIAIDPQFKNTGGDFSLKMTSPAVDGGDNSFFIDNSTKDLAGNPRIFDAANGKSIDMGAYEFQGMKVDYSNVVFNNIEAVYNGSPQSLMVQNLPQGVSASYEITDASNQTTTGNAATNAGIYQVTVTLAPIVAGADTLPETRTATLTITKAPSIITADDMQSFVYDGEAKTIAAALNHTETVLVYGPQQSYTAAGSYWITVSMPETANYSAASENVVLVIEKADFSGISLADAGFTYDGTPKSLAITGTLPETATIVYGGNEKTDAGVHTVSALIQMPNYNDLMLPATMTINKADAIITANTTQNHIYDGTVKSITASLNHSETSLIYMPQQGYTNAGSYSITVSASESANYLAASENVTLVIGKADFTGIAFSNGTFTYDTMPHSIFISGAPAEATVTYTGNARSNAGTYTVNALVQMPNYNDLELSATMTIDKIDFTGIAFSNGTFTYDTMPHSIFISGAPAEATVTYTGNAKSNAGMYTVTALIQMANYNDLELTATMTIDKIDFTGVTFSNGTFTYDTMPHSIFISGAPAQATVTYTGNAKSNAGTYTVTALVQMPNYNDLQLSATMTIDKIDFIEITFSNATFAYDTMPHSIFISGAPAEATVTYTGNAKSNAGTYTVTALIQMANYNDLELSATMTIDKIDFTGVTFSNGTFTYDTTPHSIFISGAPAQATVTYTGNAKVNAGTYTVAALIQMPNYNDLQLSATMTIDKIDFTGITFSNGTFTQDGNLHSITVLGEPNGATVTYTITDFQDNTQPGNAATNVGIYTVKAIIAMNNYNDLALEAILTIEENLGVAEPEKKEEIYVYPNPFTEVIRISDVKDLKSLAVHDVTGKLIRIMQPAAELDLSGISQGLYMLIITMENNQTKAFKIIKK